MCGIAGKIDFRAPVERATLQRMCGSLVHRGPDDQGLYVRGPVGLGERRLAIIDLSDAACAPLSNEDETVWVVFNGEIYNFQELRGDLLRRGHSFRTRSDTEVLVHLYEEYERNFVPMLRGMFAFAIWDERRQRLFAARDRLGKKPFFYYHDERGLWFGSQPRAILAANEVPVAPDYRALDLFLSRQYVPSPLTAYAGMRKLPPGHQMECTLGAAPIVSRYWAPPVQAATEVRVDAQEVGASLLAKLEESVRLRMISDVPLGALLSGGVDSGAVVALMARNSERPVKTYSIGFNEPEFDELEYARLVAQRYGTEHQEFVVDLSAAQLIGDVLREFDEPFADASALPTYLVAQLAAKHVKVVLSGDGGDESFGGYGHYRNALRWQAVDSKLPLPLRRLVAGAGSAAAALLPAGSMVLRARNWFDLVGADWPHRYRETTAVVKLPERRVLYSAALRREGLPVADSALLEVAPAAGEPTLGWMMRYDQSHYLPDCLMTKSDIASMAHSLELRCPFLDHEFVELAARIPLSLRTNRAEGKLILKRALAGKH
jgi:asparagine synthase (glutamine-hydrolysing)